MRSQSINVADRQTDGQKDGLKVTTRTVAYRPTRLALIMQHVRIRYAFIDDNLLHTVYVVAPKMKAAYSSLTLSSHTLSTTETVGKLSLCGKFLRKFW